MSDKSKNIILWIATVVIIVAYLFWMPVYWLTGGDLKAYYEHGSITGGFDIYHIGQAFFMLLVCYYLSVTFQRPVTFILVWLCAGNFVDEVFFDNTTATTTEFGYAVIIIILGFFKEEIKALSIRIQAWVKKKLRFSRKH